MKHGVIMVFSLILALCLMGVVSANENVTDVCEDTQIYEENIQIDSIDMQENSHDSAISEDEIIYSPDVHDADADYGIESSIEDQSIVSVSLANIYADQGYYDRAIQMFEILKLHFPEKNSIFAARIEELKKMMAEG